MQTTQEGRYERKQEGGEMIEFEIGDVVTLTNGVGPLMTVTGPLITRPATNESPEGGYRLKAGPSVECLWFDVHGRLDTGVFLKDLLSKHGPKR